MNRDTFPNTYECEDCGRDDHLSVKALLMCPCRNRHCDGRE
ncbi:hypothetical protein M2253_002211 [Leucobacter luti]|nr:hypothetical protein [Leucobacter luti]